MHCEVVKAPIRVRTLMAISNRVQHRLARLQQNSRAIRKPACEPQTKMSILQTWSLLKARQISRLSDEANFLKLRVNAGPGDAATTKEETYHLLKGDNSMAYELPRPEVDSS